MATRLHRELEAARRELKLRDDGGNIYESPPSHALAVRHEQTDEPHLVQRKHIHLYDRRSKRYITNGYHVGKSPHQMSRLDHARERAAQLFGEQELG